VPRHGGPTFVIDSPIARHFEILRLAPFRGLRVVKCVEHADAFDWALLHPVDEHRLRQAGGFENGQRIGGFEALAERLDAVYVVDQGTRLVTEQPDFADAAKKLGDKLHVIVQGNLGGSGGFSRSMDETVRAGTSDYVLLLGAFMTDLNLGIFTANLDPAKCIYATSEQLRCQMHLACTETASGWRAAALILEKVAGAGGIDPALNDADLEESWRTATTLGATLTDRELLDDGLPGEQLLYRLFHTEGVATDRARALSFGCRCSRARLASILEGFPAEDLDHMAIDDDIVMTCEFCNYDFRFPRQDVHGQVPSEPKPE